MAWGEYGPWIHNPAVRHGRQLIGEAVKRRRHHLALSQTTLGQLAGIPQSTISKFENGRPCGLAWWRFANLVSVLGGIDFGPLGDTTIRAIDRDPQARSEHTG